MLKYWPIACSADFTLGGNKFDRVRNPKLEVGKLKRSGALGFQEVAKLKYFPSCVGIRFFEVLEYSSINILLDSI